MIIERVDETRLMIVLAREDMVEYDLSFSKLDWCDFHSRKVIKQLLALAKEKTGFTTQGKRMMIEAAPGGDGCLILVTLLHSGRSKGRNVYRIKQPCAVFVYEFACAEDLLCAMERLSRLRRHPESATLLLFKEKYRLILSVRGGLSSPVETLLSEYGRLAGKSRAVAAATLEHGKLLSQGDVIGEMGYSLRRAGQ